MLELFQSKFLTKEMHAYNLFFAVKSRLSDDRHSLDHLRPAQHRHPPRRPQPPLRGRRHLLQRPVLRQQVQPHGLGLRVFRRTSGTVSQPNRDRLGAEQLKTKKIQ